MLRKALLGAAATGAAVLTSFAVASPAMAGTDATVRTYYNSILRGTAYWTADGDKLTVCDNRADGAGIAAQVYSKHPDGFWQFEMSAKDPSADGPCATTTKNVADGRTVEITVWQYEDGGTYGHQTVTGVA